MFDQDTQHHEVSYGRPAQGRQLLARLDTVLVAQAVLADVGRWWSGVGLGPGVDKSQVYDLVEAAAREVDAAWDGLTVTSDGSRVYTSRPDDLSLPVVTVQVFEIGHASRLIQPADLTSFLVVWDIRFWLPPRQPD